MEKCFLNPLDLIFLTSLELKPFLSLVLVVTMIVIEIKHFVVKQIGDLSSCGVIHKKEKGYHIFA